MRSLFIVMFVALFAATSPVAAQADYRIVLRQSYAEAGIPIRVVPSGVYGLRGITPRADGFTLQTEQDAVPYRVGAELNAMAQRVSGGNESNESISTDHPINASMIAVGGPAMLAVENGTIASDGKAEGNVVVEGRSILRVSLALSGKPFLYVESFPGVLAYANLVGVDASGNVYLEVQTYRSEIPLRIERAVHVVDASGERRGRLVLPTQRYCTTERDLQIDAAGHLYHLVTDEDGFSVVCWSGLADVHGVDILPPSEFQRRIHFNDLVPVPETELEMRALLKTTAGSRPIALQIAESYVVHRYTCSAANLSPTDVTAPDGDIVRTPAWLVVGRNARIPYKWGGFSTIAQFDAGLANGRYAGDINTASPSSYAYGVDCSGYVSRCWQLTSHNSTSMMATTTTLLASWDSLVPGDAVHKVGHVRLFIDRMANGALRVAESAGRDWSVSYWSYSPADLEGVYTPRRHESLSSAISTRRPTILAAVNEGAMHRLTWTCDTAGVLGYRLYQSTNGETWTLLHNEAALQSTTMAFSPSGSLANYRVSSVMNDAAQSESGWSNVVTVVSGSQQGKVLLVDGFTRETGSWRGPHHTFTAMYGTVLNQLGYTTETVQRAAVASGAVLLSEYRAVIWIAGDQSTLDTAFAYPERLAIAAYLESGGSFLVSGSEIGYALWERGSPESQSFVLNHLKASYVADNAGTLTAAGTSASIFQSIPAMRFGQAYAEDYPDVLTAAPGATLCMQYSTGTGAGISFSGRFGASAVYGKVVYLGFPIETIADEAVFSGIVTATMNFFAEPTRVEGTGESVPEEFGIEQNYPNPFNPVTNCGFRIADFGFVKLSVFDVLGQEVAVLVEGVLSAGRHTVTWNAEGLTSGVYVCRLTVGKQSAVRRMVLLR